ncbi:hypothetical protein CRE_16359 [Caenorhabditis remanei]|uniref:SANT domain-containing protein n=1 Tax=Caenorhabditis remanei TaxID=31234 RepID=E3NC95_CAERE|nr:hypothetical protein CRE_16359 [Caenorhabditis remanei]
MADDDPDHFIDSDDVDLPSTSSGSSRRRLAFKQPHPVLRDRPPFAPPVIMGMSLPDVDATPPDSTSNGSLIDNRPKLRKAWSYDEVCVFYEGMKIHGKDFDTIVRYMAKRKIEKSREHVKTFFFNSVKAYRALLGLAEDEFNNVQRDARELFILINACEWKRKTGNMKANAEKMKELLFEGQVTVKAGRKYVTVRTPPCPALCRYFSIKKSDKIPHDLYIHLEPTSNGDHLFMRNRDQNPFLRVRLNANDRIQKLLEFLHKKWSSTGDTSAVSVTLWPDSSCELASLSVHSVESSPFISVSINKLIKNIEEVKEKSEATKKLETGELKMAVEANTTCASIPLQTFIYPRPFNLTDTVINEGITMKNIKSSIIAELYCVCGRKNPIKLRYQIVSEQAPRVPPVEPWKVMCGLLGRGYGDILKKKMSIEPPSNKRKKMDENSKSPPPAPEEPGNPECDIVRQENEDFATQLASLRKMSRKKTVAVKKNTKKPQSIVTTTPQLSIRPLPDTAPPTEEPHEFTAPICTVIPRRTTSSEVATEETEKTNESGKSKMPIDFSDVVFSPAKKRFVDMELQKKRTEEFLSSLKTPQATPPQTPGETTMQQLFGDELSMSPNSTRHAALIGDGANTSVVDFTDMMYEQLPNHNDSLSTNPALDFSVTEVHRHYNDMLSSSQNSHDYVLGQFQRKARKTPKKK